MNKQNKNKLIDTDTHWWLPEGKVGERRAKWVKGVKCKMTDRHQTFGGEYIIGYRDIKL